jgi:hypothetical protein
VGVGHTVVVRCFIATVVGVIVVVVAGAGCATARGLADDGHLTEACRAVTPAPFPAIDDDGPALASRIRRKLPGHASATIVDVRALAVDPALLVGGADLVELVVDGGVFVGVDRAVVVDAVGTEVPAARVDEAALLALFAAPPPPAPTLVTTTHTPGALEILIKDLGTALIGVPVAVMTLGLVRPDLNGLLSTGPSTSTWAQASPELPAWRARDDVIAAAALGASLHAFAPVCSAGGCRVLVVVRHAAAWAAVRVELELELDGCRLFDTLTVPLSTTTPLADTAPDAGQWQRFSATGFGLYPLLDDLEDGAEDCCAAPDAALDFLCSC